MRFLLVTTSSGENSKSWLHLSATGLGGVGWTDSTGATDYFSSSLHST